MKRWTILISLAALFLSRLAPAFGAEMPLKIINVAVPAVSLLQAPLFVAIDAEAFKKYGMDVRYVRTGARTIQALIGDSVQFAQLPQPREYLASFAAGHRRADAGNFSRCPAKDRPRQRLRSLWNLAEDSFVRCALHSWRTYEDVLLRFC